MGKQIKEVEEEKTAEKFEGFDRVFPLIGGHNHYQWFLLSVVALQAGLFALHHIGYVFLGAVPDHWCQIDELQSSNWTRDEIRQISIPVDDDGGKFKKCEYYNLDYARLAQTSYNFDEALARVSSSFGEASRKPCTKWNYDQSIYNSTVVTQFDLVCDRAYLVATIQATYMAGVFVGSLFMGGLSDSFLGRRRAVLISVVLVMVSGFGAAFANSYSAFVFFRFFIAAGVAGSFQNCFTIRHARGCRKNIAILGALNSWEVPLVCSSSGSSSGSGTGTGTGTGAEATLSERREYLKNQVVLTVSVLEYSDTSYRALMGMIQQIPFAIGYMILPVYAYFIRDWFKLQLAFSASTLVLLSYFWTLPESSRWLAARGREDDALKILQGIAKRNKKPKPHPLELLVILEACKDEGRQSQRSILEDNIQSLPLSTRFSVGLKILLWNYWNLLATPELRKRTIVIWIMFISVTLVYYGVAFDSALLTNDPFLLVFLGGLMEIPGYCGVTPFAARWGRTPTVATTFILSGASLIFVALIPFEYKIFRVIFTMSGKLFISGCFGVIYLLGTELYPTATRATGLGSAVLMGRFGSILAPYVVSLTKSVYSDMPSIIFGVAGLSAGLVAFLLPETKNVEMMESVKSIETHSVPTRRFSDAGQALLNLLPRKSQPDVSHAITIPPTIPEKVELENAAENSKSPLDETISK